MPTENRSSNTEMVSFPRELSDDLAELIATRARVCGGGAFEIWEAICEGFAAPAPQPHPEPIAWMVGTAFWWTKEEAERDAAATGLPIVGMGPMAGAAPAEQQQGEPVAWLARAIDSDGTTYRQCVSTNQLTERDTRFAWGEGVLNRCRLVISPLYTHADPGEADRLRAGIGKHWKVVCDQRAELDTLRAQLAKAHALLREWLEDLEKAALNRPAWEKVAAIKAALSASAEPTAPVLKRHHHVTMFQRGEAKP